MIDALKNGSQPGAPKNARGDGASSKPSGRYIGILNNPSEINQESRESLRGDDGKTPSERIKDYL